MKHFLQLSLLFFLILSLEADVNCYSQQGSAIETRLIQKKISASNQSSAVVTYNTKGIGNILLTFYQRFISRQISADCIFHPSCSRYSRACINKYGLILGVLMTGDRLTRCNSFSSRDIPQYKINQNDYVDDAP